MTKALEVIQVVGWIGRINVVCFRCGGVGGDIEVLINLLWKAQGPRPEDNV